MAENPLPPYVHTEWNHYDLPAIWQQIQPEDDYFTRLQERAWNRTYDLLDAHRAKLKERRYLAAFREVFLEARAVRRCGAASRTRIGRATDAANRP